MLSGSAWQRMEHWRSQHSVWGKDEAHQTYKFRKLGAVYNTACVKVPPNVPEYSGGDSLHQVTSHCNHVLTQASRDNGWNTTQVKKSQTFTTHSLGLVMRRG